MLPLWSISSLLRLGRNARSIPSESRAEWSRFPSRFPTYERQGSASISSLRVARFYGRRVKRHGFPGANHDGQSHPDDPGGELVLPAIQREFVWDDRQIVRLFDSVLRGYPIGTFLCGK